MPVPKQMDYLSYASPDYKAMPSEQKLGYLNHVTGKQAPTTGNNEIENKTAGTTGSSPWRALKSVGQDVSGIVSGMAQNGGPMGIPGQAMKTATDIVQSDQDRKAAGYGPGYRIAAGIGQGTGLINPTAMEEAAAHGDVAGVAGHAVIPTALALAPLVAEHPMVRAGAQRLSETIPAMAESAKPVATAPVRFVARGMEHAVNEIPGISSLRSAKGLMQPADEAAALRIKVPGRDFGLPESKPFTPMGPSTPSPEQLGSMRAVSQKPFELTSPPQETRPVIQQKMEFPTEIPAQAEAAPTAQIPAGRTGPPMQRLGELIEQGAGAPPAEIPTLKSNVPLREQRQLQKPFGNRAAVEVSELHGPRTTAPEQIPQVIPNAVDQAMGADLTPEASEKARLQQKYPDAGDRQAIHRTSEKIFEATRDNPKLRKALGDLKAHDNQGGPDLARAAANLGEDLGQRRIGNKMLMGEGQIGRGEMFDRLLDKGHTPQQIFDAAHAEPATIPTLAKPGPMRAGRTGAREKTGD